MGGRNDSPLGHFGPALIRGRLGGISPFAFIVSCCLILSNPLFSFVVCLPLVSTLILFLRSLSVSALLLFCLAFCLVFSGRVPSGP